MSINWGPFFIVPSESQKTLSGRVVLRESFDEELLKKELDQLGYAGAAISATNPWYYRKKNTESWMKINESSDRQNNFAVPWETATLENGQYQILGVMHVSIKKGEEERVIARQNIMDIKIKN
jgi:hypothetical protein